jgi:tRNA U54 and U55 pseudouridine synthase Pus10
VPLPAELLGLAEENLQDRLRNTFRVFQTGSPFVFEIPDPANTKVKLKVTEKMLQDEADKLRKEYFIPLGSSSYGSLILKRQKPEFEEKVKRLRTLVQAYADCVRKDIAKAIAATRDDLLGALWPRIKAAPPKQWLKRSADGHLSENALGMRLEEEVDKAFDKVEESFDPKVVCLFKGVTYQTITSDKHFRSAVEKFFGKEESEKLFSEYEASPVKDQCPA